MIFQFKIRLSGSKNPEIWRQVVVPSDYSFMQFHKVIRTAFNKEFPQKLMFTFSPSGKGSNPQISSIELPVSGQYGAKTTLLSSIFKHRGQTLTYQPDYTDDWQHHIVLEQITNGNITDADCLAGEGAYPPETCAGFDDYEEMKQILSDKNHLQYKFIHEWLELGENETWEEAHNFNSSEVKEQLKQIDAEEKNFRNYTIVKYDSFDEQYGLNPSLWKLIDKTKAQIYEGKNTAATIQELEALTRKYPNIPHFKNSLALAYLQSDINKDKDSTKRFFELTLPNFANYPDYVMARCSLAHRYAVDQPEKALELLGKEFDLSVLYPDRDGKFTDVEIFNYHIAVFKYCLEIQDETEAEKQINFLEYLFPDEIRGSTFETQFMLFRMKKRAESIPQRQSVEVIPEQVEATKKAPDFEHPEIEILFKEGANIERATLNRMMALPRESLIRDLEKILVDSIARLQYFDENPDLDLPYASQHALYMLSALEAEEAIETLLKVLRQNKDYYGFWYGDMLTDDFWRFIYMMGKNLIDRLKDFILEPHRHTYARTAVSDAVMRIVLHQPERKEEVFKWYEDVLQYMMEHKTDTTIFEKTVYSFLLNDFTKIAGKEQFPLVNRFCDESLVDQFIFPLQEVKQSLAKKKFYNKKDEIYTSIHQYYDDWQTWFNKNSNDEASKNKSYLSPFNTPSAPQIAAPKTPKVGRNDPCSCGSGKKYKKCCGG